MAAATMSAIDLGAQASLPVRLGVSISKKDGQSRWSSLRYNHKPRLDREKSIESRLQVGQDGEDERVLKLKQGDAEWEYAGRRRAEEQAYVLILSTDGNRECTLERLEDAYAMNLVQTPENGDAKHLARQYPHLSESETGLYDNEGDAGNVAPDPSNPFDFRHFLAAAEKKAQDSQRDALSSSQTARSAAGTPLQQPARSTPVARPTKAAAAAKKRKTPSAAATKPNPKRVRAGQPEPPRPASTKSAATASEKPAAPEIRLDRKASIRHPSASQDIDLETWQNPNDGGDDGELILENAPSNSHKQHNSMSLALSGAFAGSNGGPRSLLSAASSPGSRVNSPHPAVAEEEAPEEPSQQTYTFEFGDSSPRAEEDDDGDVEDLELGSPVHESRPVSRRPSKLSTKPVVAADEPEEEDDMEAQLALAMAQAEDEPAAAPNAYESEEDVSEEE